MGGAAPGPGSGLADLEARVAALAGRLVVESPPGAGTTVQAEIPLGCPGQRPITGSRRSIQAANIPG